MNKFFAVAGLVLVVMLTALFAVPAMIDWRQYRGSFEDEASRLLGRPVRLGDHVRLRLLPTPDISFDNVRVADATGHFDTPLLRADKFRMQLAIGALLTGSLVAQDIEMTRPALRLAIGDDGRGNWVGLGTSAKGSGAEHLGALALNAVHIDKGSVEVQGAAGWHLTFDNVTGDLEAPALTGPYHFKGQIESGGKAKDLRFSANREDATGKTRLNIAWHDPAPGAASYVLDGVVDHLDATPALTGSVTLQIPATDTGLPAVDLKSSLEASPDLAKLSGIDVLFDSAGRPQRLTGEATLSWREGTGSTVTLNSVWLDLDKISGAAKGSPPLAALRQLYDRLGGAPKLADASKLKLTVAEAVLGGAPVNDIALEAHVNGSDLAIDSLRARLPGLSRLDAQGAVGGAAGDSFDGTVRLWGANLGAMVNWASPGAGAPDKPTGSAYLLDGAVKFDGTHVAAEPLRMEISGTTVTGGFAYADSEPRSLSISLDSGRLDLAALSDTPMAGAALAALIASANGDAPEGADAPGGTLRKMMSGDTHLDLRIGDLMTAGGQLRDVSAKLDRTGGRLDIPAIDLTTGDGLGLHVEGALEAKQGNAEGQLRLTLAAKDGKALVGAARLAGFGDLPAGTEAAFAALTPLKLAGSMQIGGSDVNGERLRLDGLADGSRLTAVLERDAGDADWQSTRLDIAADLANADGGRLVSQLAQALGAALPGVAPAVAGAGNGQQPAGPARLALRASGVPKSGVITTALLDSAPLRGSFDGRSEIEPDGGLGFAGTVTADAASGSTVLALARLDKLLPPVDGPVKLSATASRQAGVLSLADARVVLPGDTLIGEARLDQSVQPPKLTATLASGTLRLDRLLAALAPGTDGTTASVSPQAPKAGASAAAGPGGGVLPLWPDRQLNFAALDGYAAQIEAKAGKLVLADGIEVADATLTAASTPAGIDFTLTKGRMARGSVSGHLRLAKAAAGGTLSADARLDGAALDGLSGPQSGLPRPQGRLLLNVKLDGHGLTPRDLATTAGGSGDFSLTDGSISGMAPLGPDDAARDVLAMPGQTIAVPVLLDRLAKARFGAPFPMLGAHGSLSIADGSLHFDKLKVQGSRADLEVANRVDLATLHLASVWTLTPKSPEADKPALAAVSFNFEGPLYAFAGLQPTTDADALARDLTARKVLGGPELLQGIWPAAPANGEVPPAAETPAAPSADAAPPVAPADAAAPSAASASGALPPATAASAAPADITAAQPATALATDPAAQDAARKAQAQAQAAHPHKKKSNWAASFFQSIFGN